MSRSGPWSCLLLLSASLISVESFCHVGVILADEENVFRQTQLSASNESLCSFSMEYQVDVETCVFSHLKGIAAVETTNCDKSGCHAEMATAPKRIGCCCVGSGCNGEKALIQKDLALFKKNLEHRPKTNALLLHELACLMKYFKFDETSRSAASSIRDFFTDPLHVSLFIFGCVIAVLAVVAIWWLCFKTKKEQRKPDEEETKSLGSGKGTTTE